VVREVYFIALDLYDTIRILLDALGNFDGSKILRMRIGDQLKAAYGVTGLCYMQWIPQLVKSHLNRGEWAEGQSLQEELLRSWRELLSREEKESAIGGLELQLTSATDVLAFANIADKRKQRLNQSIPKRSTTKSRLVRNYSHQGRWKETEKPREEVSQTNLRILGAEHPPTLTSTMDLVTVYQNKGKWKKGRRTRDLSFRNIGASTVIEKYLQTVYYFRFGYHIP
jgi:hypothetical protein